MLFSLTEEMPLNYHFQTLSVVSRTSFRIPKQTLPQRRNIEWDTGQSFRICFLKKKDKALEFWQQIFLCSTVGWWREKHTESEVPILSLFNVDAVAVQNSSNFFPFQFHLFDTWWSNVEHSRLPGYFIYLIQFSTKRNLCQHRL